MIENFYYIVDSRNSFVSHFDDGIPEHMRMRNAIKPVPFNSVKAATATAIAMGLEGFSVVFVKSKKEIAS